MSPIRDVIIASALPAVKEFGKAELKQVLTALREEGMPQSYKNVLSALYSNFGYLRAFAIKTKTGIDDGVIDMLLEVVREMADDDGIALM